MYGLNRMKEDDKIRLDLETALTDTINLLDLRMPYSKEFYASPGELQRLMCREAIYEKMGGYDEIIATCIGHTHIDGPGSGPSIRCARNPVAALPLC